MDEHSMNDRRHDRRREGLPCSGIADILLSMIVNVVSH